MGRIGNVPLYKRILFPFGNKPCGFLVIFGTIAVVVKVILDAVAALARSYRTAF